MSCVKMRTIVKQKKVHVIVGFVFCFDDLTLTDYTKQYWSRCFLHNGLTWRDVTSATPVYTYPAAVHQ